MRVGLIASLVCLCLVGLANADPAHAAIRKDLNVPAEELGSALQTVAKDYDFQVLYRTEIVKDLRTQGAVGSLTSDEALGKVLKGTGLTYKYLDSNTVTIYPVSASASNSSPGSVGSAGNADNNGGGKKSSQDFRVAQVDQGKGAGAAAVGNQSNSQQSSNGQTAGLAEIIVTAQKRSERVQDVPASIQVLSGVQLQDQGALQLSDFAKQVPGMALIGSSGPGQGQVVLRGISAGSGSSALVGVYLDDVPMRASSPNSDVIGEDLGFDPDLADIERIEVLGGPQSTLYGASSMGGVVKFVTKQPDLSQYSGSIRLDGSQVDGGGGGYGVRGSVNLPIVTDAVGLRAAAYYRDDPGFVDNDFNGVKNVNRDSVKGARLSLLIKFTDDLETTLSGLAQDIDGSGPNLVYLNPLTLRPLNGLAYSNPFLQYSSTNRTLSDLTTLNLHFATLTNIASFADSVGKNNSDFTNFAGFAGAPPGTLAYAAPWRAESRRLSDELRLASSPGQLEWLLGLFYTHEKDPDRFPVRGADSDGVIFPLSNPFSILYNYNNVNIFDEKAVFGDLTYHVTEKLEGTVGLRYSVNNQSFDALGVGDLVGSTPLVFIGNSRNSAITYLGTLSYKLSPDTSVYTRAASAYRPGGPNILGPTQLSAGAPPSYGSDKLWNYEVGVKGSAWDRRIVYSADVYHMDWKDMQLNVNIAGGTVVANASSAKSDGVEASIQFAPVDGLTIGVNGAYTDAKLTSDIPAPTNAVSGSPLPYAPKTTASAVLDYRLVEFQHVVPRVGFTYAHHGSFNTGFSTAGVSTLPSYETLDVRGGVDWERFSLIARVDNVANKYALTDAQTTNALGAPLGGIIIKPRTFGLSLQARF